MSAGPSTACAERQRVAQENVRFAPCAVGKKRASARSAAERGGRVAQRLGARARQARAAPPTASTDDRLDHERLAAIDEAEARLVRASRRRAASRATPTRIDLERRVGARVAQMRARCELDRPRRDALRRDLARARSSRERVDDAARAAASAPASSGSSTPCSRMGADVGEAHAIGRQQRRQRMDQHAS